MNEEILTILNLYLSEELLTEEQESILQEWLKASSCNEDVLRSLEDNQFLQRSVQDWDSYAESEEIAWRRLSSVLFNTSQNQRVHRKVHFIRKWGWVAASIIFLVGVGAYLWYNNRTIPDSPVAIVDSLDIQPGKKGAILTLADGSSVVLDSLQNGIVGSQDGSQAIMENGKLRYDLKEGVAGEVKYNTMTTTRGKQFDLTLPDGTRVWLNAVSSIRYPTRFTGKERRVEITGEAYFEVAQNAQTPFLVSINNKLDIEVLGTHFNVNSYESSIHTTLLEGRVKVRTLNAGASAATLKPGQQARTGNSIAPGFITVLDQVDLQRVIAWKNGYFNFEGLRFEEITKQLERWYDIEVIFEKGIPQKKIWGEMTKDVPLSGVLKYFSGLGIKFRLEERKLIISQ